MSTASGVTNTERFWEVYERKLLRILVDVGGSATLFELQIRSGATPLAVVHALRRLTAFGLVTERQVNDQHVVIRLSSAA
jgi:hypothetical protein